ncbi:MAG: sugar ABC transporter ATP-binding protein [Alphaproteobacteria bacterium]
MRRPARNRARGDAIRHGAKPVWELIGITKDFPGVRANDNVSLKLHPGVIHGLLGGNGSGKSTLIKILSGAHQPDAGEIRLRGKPVTLDNPIVARNFGIATVFQEFSLVPTLTVAENIYLGHLPTRSATGTVDWKSMREGAVRTLASLEIHIDPDAVVGALSVAEQQLVEIAKAIAADASVIILDEPTTALGAAEVERLHELLQRMKRQGRAILYISHRLDEVVGIVDMVTILKDGKVVSSAEESRIDIDDIVRKMIGQEIEEHYPKVANATDRAIFEARDIRTENKVNGVSFALRCGEVIGLGGVLGSGRTEIARALFGIDPLTGGEIRLRGRPVRFDSPRQAIRAGIAYLPENRKFDGLFFNFQGRQNITVANLRALSKGGLLDLGEEKRVGRFFMRELKMPSEAEAKFVDVLSGGNQQKVIVARWLYSGADIFILDEPTQGIDIGAKIAIFNLINDLTARNKAVILISSDHDELLAMSDRVGVVRNGSIIDMVDADELSKAELARMSSGGTVIRPSLH